MSLKLQVHLAVNSPVCVHIQVIVRDATTQLDVQYSLWMYCICIYANIDTRNYVSLSFSGNLLWFFLFVFYCQLLLQKCFIVFLHQYINKHLHVQLTLLHEAQGTGHVQEVTKGRYLGTNVCLTVCIHFIKN